MSSSTIIVEDDAKKKWIDLPTTWLQNILQLFGKSTAGHRLPPKKKQQLWTDESWATFEGHLVKNSTTNGPCARSGWQTTECHILAEKISPAVPLLFWN